MGASTALYICGFLLYCFTYSPCKTMGANFSAYFIFGDSLVDVGNNNYITTLAKANSLPNGIDFQGGPTGRFSNGKIITDFLCDNLSLPYPPPYLAPNTTGQAILKGVNYASGAGGILRSTGANFIGRVDMDTQVSWFGNTIQELKQQLGENATQDLLKKSLFSTTIGSNDYINNYLLTSPLTLRYTPSEFQEVLLSNFSSQLRELYNLGARSFLVVSLGPIGCIPSQLALRSVIGECSDFVNTLAYNFNNGLKLKLANLSSQLAGSKFMYADVYQPTFAYRSNPQQYGFKFASEACCGAGRFNGQIPCLPFLKPCPDRPDYIFWDAYHPTESANKLVGKVLDNALG